MRAAGEVPDILTGSHIAGRQELNSGSVVQHGRERAQVPRARDRARVRARTLEASGEADTGPPPPRGVLRRTRRASRSSTARRSTIGSYRSVRAEQDNFRQALRWTLERGGDDGGLDGHRPAAGAGELGWFWFLRRLPPAEARDWFEALLSPTRGRQPPVRARA